MPRVTFVKKARKDNPAAGIKKGESYYWWGMMVGGRGVKRYSKTQPRRSQLTNSEFLGGLYDLEDRISALNAEASMEDEVTDIANDFRSLGEEQADKLSNMPDSLQQGPTGELLQQRADRCEEIAGELEQIDFSDKPDGTEDRNGVDEANEENSEDDAEQSYWDAKLEEVQGIDCSVE